MSTIRRHPYAVTIVTLVAVVALSAALPADGVLGATLRSSLPALVVIGALVLVDRRRLLMPARRSHTFPWAPVLYLAGISLLVLVLAAIGLAALAPEDRSAVDWGVLPYLLVICAGTGYLEEGFFRGLLADAFVTTLKPGKHAVLNAAIVSSALFGILHVVGTGQATDGVQIAFLIVKPIEAGIFGFFMAAIYVRTSSISAAALIHTLFDLMLLAPSFLTTGTLPDTYLSGDGTALTGLIIATVALLPLVLWSWKLIRGAEGDYRPMFVIRPEREDGADGAAGPSPR